ncbi:3-hydroxyacyl-ACP dehydratase FabZ [Desulfohalobium retbaense]|uniref:3-hydroxyacyl-[acyl-carrier-protein] dehydratase FabZ n=1 Tax=Desulfohalobium retbaense (strain ATCC 49708 / DSM 5692 / JCM 16813 / HR100) TaxID=485915 RepID=C8X515_DESRD|nr:3-hydroxyacyl-ACP dehydratase FabZ [Desulfohalobium retbaense]ACV69512.1 beta-hydroxyacyl-(acyl-carrier-protein) dehydratase FabZ [Desulfohalobium retbaense DSM 5692]
MSESVSVVECRDILAMLPHRYPFLLVDRVLQYAPYESLQAIKNVTFNEPYFQGHFPDYPVMPGVLILEALAQAGGILVVKSMPEIIGSKIFLFTGIEKVRFRQPVFPGDQLHLSVEYVRHKLNMWKMRATAQVEQRLVAQGEFNASIVDRED